MRIADAAAISRAGSLATSVQEFLGASYEVRCTSQLLSARDFGDFGTVLDVAYAVTVWPQSDPTSKVTVRQLETVDSDGSTGGRIGTTCLDTYRDLRGLPSTRQPAMLRYLATSGAASQRAYSVRLMDLGRIEAPTADDPRVEQLIDTARQSGRDSRDCVYIRYEVWDTDPGTVGTVVAYDASARSYVTLATRNGRYPTPFVEATTAP